MIKKQLIMVSLACCALSSAFANEWRTPLVIEKGPLRYDLEMKRNKWSLDTWGAIYRRSADRSFLKHGTDTKSLPAVIFGKEEFTIGETFDDSAAVQSSGYFSNFNPFLFTSKFRPSATYTDEGMTVGGRFEYPVWENKGRFGVKASIPFKRIRMERNDNGDCPVDGSNDMIIRGDAVRMVDATPAGKVFGQQRQGDVNNITRYKMALLNQLRYLRDADGATVRVLQLKPAGTASGFLNNQYNLSAANVGAYRADAGANAIPFVIMRATDGLFPPYSASAGVTVSAGGVFAPADGNGIVRYNNDGTLSVAAATANLQALSADASNLDATNGFAFVQDRDYTNLASADRFNELWVTPVFDGATGIMSVGQPKGTVEFIEALLSRYQQGAECLLEQHGFMFNTYERTGLGDLLVDAFYEHTFNDSVRSEAWLGVKFPTGGSNKYCCNPYRLQLGNGNHFEINFGANVGWQTPINWLAIKADLSYAWVIQSEEQRTAVFKRAVDNCCKTPCVEKASCEENKSCLSVIENDPCARVRGIGPCVCADVDWGYLTGHIDFNFYHPKSKNLGTMIGYELYYKTHDNICFKKKSSTDHILGQVWANGTTLVPASETAGGNDYVDYEMPLDNCAAEKNTDAIAHRLRFETHWHAHKYWSLYAGGAYTFAGKNIFRETDMHAGIAIRY